MSVDIWIFVAVLFVSCSLIELAIVGHLHRMERGERKRKRKKSTLLLSQDSSVNPQSTKKHCRRRNSTKRLQTENGDVTVSFFLYLHVLIHFFKESENSGAISDESFKNYGTFALWKMSECFSPTFPLNSRPQVDSSIGVSINSVAPPIFFGCPRTYQQSSVSFKPSSKRLLNAKFVYQRIWE